MKCPICRTEQRPKQRCCSEEFTRLRSKLNNQSRCIERLEDQYDRANRSLDKQRAKFELSEVQHPDN